jgi:hypothetical protein
MELELNDGFKDLLRLLNSKNVRYLLIGGYAVALHGQPRLTNELDIVIANDASNVTRSLDALRDESSAGSFLNAQKRRAHRY